MVDKGTDTPYYAIRTAGGTTDTNNGENTGGKWSSTPINPTIGTATLSGASATETYTCGYKITVTASGNMVQHLKEGDAKIVLTGTGLQDTGDSESNHEFDLKKESSFNSSESGDSMTLTKEFKGTFTLTNTTNTNEIKAGLYLVNKSASGDDSSNADQNVLAGKTLSVAFNIATDGECTVSKTAD